jgi:hypothetical protein
MRRTPETMLMLIEWGRSMNRKRSGGAFLIPQSDVQSEAQPSARGLSSVLPHAKSFSPRPSAATTLIFGVLRALRGSAKSLPNMPGHSERKYPFQPLAVTQYNNYGVL